MVVISGAGLTVADIARVAAGEPVAVSAAAREYVGQTFEYANRVSADRPVYGRTTAVGANRFVTVDAADRTATAAAILRSHATAGGELRSSDRVRAMLVVRLNQLAAGGSGVHPSVLDGLCAMLNEDALPPVREWGGIGTADLPALAVTALALRGEVPTTRPLSIGPLEIGEALPLISSNAATIADAALAAADLEPLADAGLLTAALSLHATSGNLEAFAVAVERVTPFTGARHVCRRMREFAADAAPARRLQDPFGLRTLPQVHGPFHDALVALAQTITGLANAPSENPVFLTGDGVSHHGGFHAAYLAQSLDTAILAAAQAAQLSLARLAMLTDPGYTTLPPFLGDGRPGASGVMVVEYVAASALAALRALATPAALQTVSLSRGIEEDASFASLAATQALAAVAAYRTVIACELVAAVRCLRLRSLTPAVLTRIEPLLAEFPTATEDRDLTADIAAAEAVLPHLPTSL